MNIIPESVYQKIIANVLAAIKDHGHSPIPPTIEETGDRDKDALEWGRIAATSNLAGDMMFSYQFLNEKNDKFRLFLVLARFGQGDPLVNFPVRFDRGAE